MLERSARRACQSPLSPNSDTRYQIDSPPLAPIPARSRQPLDALLVQRLAGAVLLLRGTPNLAAVEARRLRGSRHIWHDTSNREAGSNTLLTVLCNSPFHRSNKA